MDKDYKLLYESSQEALREVMGELAEARRQLETEVAAHSRSIDERDHHEESINQIAVALGLECEWSNLCDVGHECINEAANLRREVAASQQRERELREHIKALLYTKPSIEFDVAIARAKEALRDLPEGKP